MILFSEGFYQLLKRFEDLVKMTDSQFSSGMGMVLNNIRHLIFGLRNGSITDEEAFELIINIIDDFDRSRAIQSKIESKDKMDLLLNNFGIYISSELIASLRSAGVEEIPARFGDRFSPEIHKAVHSVPGTKFGFDAVVEVLRRGFIYLKRRIIRFSEVIVEKFIRKPD